MVRFDIFGVFRGLLRPGGLAGVERGADPITSPIDQNLKVNRHCGTNKLFKSEEMHI